MARGHEPVWELYNQLLGASRERAAMLNVMFLGCTSMHVFLGDLEASFSEGEVLAALNDMAIDKAHGDDYTVLFFHTCWSTIKVKVITTV